MSMLDVENWLTCMLHVRGEGQATLMWIYRGVEVYYS